MSIDFGVIGGSGVYNIKDLNVVREQEVDTPFGKPSDKIKIGNFGGDNIAFLPRHGVGHRLLPGEVNYRANIYALKSLGVKRILAVSAVGSLKKDIAPLDLVVPDQLIDRSKANRESSFFGNGVVGHVAFADPFCPDMREILYQTGKELGYKIHNGGTLVCMEGPQFSTRAESNLYRSWGADLIGMTALPETKLAREAEICYTILALSTDYDCWYDEEEDVTVEMVVENVRKNSEKAQMIIKKISTKLPDSFDCGCQDAAKFAVQTSKDAIPDDAKKKLDLLYGKYFGAFA